MAAPLPNAGWDHGLAPEPAAANPIALTDILALRVPVHWAEAVAVVEALCEVLLADAPVSPWIPATEDVLVTAHGGVIVRRGAEGTSDVDDLSRILHALLDPAATPMPIRLFVAHAIGSGQYDSVRAYAEALAYYGRPGRADMIGSLYRRCLETPAADVLAPDAPPPEELPEEEANRPKRRRWAVAVASGFVFAAAATAAVWFWGLDPRVSASVSGFREAVQAAARATVQTVGWGASPAPPDPQTPETGAPVQRSRRAGAPRSAEADTLAGVGTVSPPLIGAPRLGDSRIPGTIEGGFARPPAAAAAAPIDATVYSSAMPDVQPPVMFFPQLPPASAQPGAPGTNTMELLIDEAGRVQRVRLVSDPVRLPDMTLLSAAKTWKFHPALKDGRPVKYRLPVSWEVTPP